MLLVYYPRVNGFAFKHHSVLEYDRDLNACVEDRGAVASSN